MIRGKSMRRSELLPLFSFSSDREDLYYHEAQTSSLAWGPDEDFWTELFLVDTYFGSERSHKVYLAGCIPHRVADFPWSTPSSIHENTFS
jgi:hypothetical protein